MSAACMHACMNHSSCGGPCYAVLGTCAQLGTPSSSSPLQVIEYYARKVISLNADKPQPVVASQIDKALS